MKYIQSSILFVISACLLTLTASFTYAQITQPDSQATAQIKGTSGKYAELAGTAILKETEEGLKINVDVKGVPPGKHGFHIHEKGDCADEGKAAGGHYNPNQVIHGHLPTQGPEKAHAGDMGNITIAEDGTGKLEVLLPGVHLTGVRMYVTGLAVIVHEKEDDFGQPTGNAGGRIGCGIISSAEPQPQTLSTDGPKTDTLPELTYEEDQKNRTSEDIATEQKTRNVSN